jgi:hypothetical protein
MTTTLLTLAIIGLIFYLAPTILSIVVGRSPERLNLTNVPQRFNVSRWFLFVAFGGFVTPGFFVLLPFIAGISNRGAWIFFISLAMIFLAITLTASLRLPSTHVTVDNEVVQFAYGKTVKTIRRSDLKKVYTSNGFIVLDTGTIPRLAIPMIFSQTKQLYWLLQGG